MSTPEPTTVVHLPAQTTGPALAALVRQVRRAALHGEVVIDGSGADVGTPGLRLVLERLQELAVSSGPPGTRPHRRTRPRTGPG